MIMSQPLTKKKKTQKKCNKLYFLEAIFHDTVNTRSELVLQI